MKFIVNWSQQHKKKHQKHLWNNIKINTIEWYEIWTSRFRYNFQNNAIKQNLMQPIRNVSIIYFKIWSSSFFFVLYFFYHIICRIYILYLISISIFKCWIELGGRPTKNFLKCIAKNHHVIIRIEIWYRYINSKIQKKKKKLIFSINHELS